MMQKQKPKRSATLACFALRKCEPLLMNFNIEAGRRQAWLNPTSRKTGHVGLRDSTSPVDAR